MRKKYSSDVSLEQFEKIRSLLEGARKRTRPRRIDLYDIFCGVLYLLKSGCQWRMIPSDFSKWRTIHFYFQTWSEAKEGEKSILDQALKKNGWRGPYRQWTEREDLFLHRGRSKR